MHEVAKFGRKWTVFALLVCSATFIGERFLASRKSAVPDNAIYTISVMSNSVLSNSGAILALNEFENRIVSEERTTRWAADLISYREQPFNNAVIMGLIEKERAVFITGKTAKNWFRIDVDGAAYYIPDAELLDEDPVAKRLAEEQAKKAEEEKKAQQKVRYASTGSYSPAAFRRRGVIYWGGWRFTWYSERVLPGGGLRIPGRHSDGTFVRDGQNYLCVASGKLKRGTVIDTPWGKAKVYDSGCAADTIDMYVSW